MAKFGSLHDKLQHLYSFLWLGIHYLLKFSYWVFSITYDFIVYHISHFWIKVGYFSFISCFGFVILHGVKPKTYPSKPRNLDLFFTSVSATTVSSMSTIEIEVFSNAQLIILTILMFIGGEVFTSMVGLHFKAFRVGNTPLKAKSRVNSLETLPLPPNGFESNHIELNIITTTSTQGTTTTTLMKSKSEINFLLKSKSIRVLGFLVLTYLLVTHVIGISMVLAYLDIESSAKKVLESKGLKTFTFSIFTIVSTFASCGFIPTNENMVVFRQNSGLLLMLIPQILLGNTLFPSFLRLSIWTLGKFANYKEESNYLMRSTSKEIGFHHLLSSKHSKYLVVTIMGFILVQFILFCSMDWSLEGLNGLNVYQKLVAMLFQCVNARHTGESVVDLSTIAYAVFVVFIIMMYLPPYTSFLPPKDDEEEEYPQINALGKKKREILLENVIFSQLSYLAIFITIICITERQKMKEDPLNFNVFNIVVEVISAYGNVGFTTGYSCKRQLKPDTTCVDKWYGFAGRWSDQGKIFLIIVMFFGRLKKFNMDGGKAWKLL